MALEYKKIKAPDGFDDRNPRHVDALLTKLADNGLGDGWQIQGYDRDSREVLVSRASAMVSVADGALGARGKRVALGGRFGPNDGQRAAEQLESRPEFDGLRLVSFRPHIDEAVLAPLTDQEANARSKVASVLGVKPWEVQVVGQPSGGFVVQLPRDRYLPAKHDDKLQETVEDGIGRFGWFINVDKATARATITPAAPPTFPAMIGYPKADRPGGVDWQLQLPIGKELAALGADDGEPLLLDLDGAVGALVTGVAGGGKSVAINGIIYGALERGWEVAIGDVESKAVDFAWCKPYVRTYGFGCSGLRSTAALASEVFDEVDKRARLLAEHGVQKWQELPDEVRPAPLLLVLDELQGLYAKEVEPKSLDRDHPMRVEAIQHNMAVDILAGKVSKIAAQARFVGVRLLLATQQANERTGISTALRMNLPNRLLCGVNPDASSRRSAFQNEKAVPEVPAHIRGDKIAGRGVGSFEFQGVEPGTFKSYFETTDTYLEWIERAGAPRTDSPDVPDFIIDRHFGEGMGGDEDGFGRVLPAREPWELGPDGEPLTGRERANAARREATLAARGGQ